MSFIINFIWFFRLYIVIGMSLSIVVLYVIVLVGSVINELYLGFLGFMLFSCLGVNIYIVGLNQIMDVEIDKINKFYLLLVLGVFFMWQGYFIVGLLFLVFLVIVIYFGEYLLFIVVLSLVLGMVYLLLLVCLKCFLFWVVFCIIVVCGLIVNLLLFLYFNSLINGGYQFILVVFIFMFIIFVYSIIIVWFKDIFDMEGDCRYDISIFSICFGVKWIFLLGNGLISFIFLVLIIFVLFWFNLFYVLVMIVIYVLFFLVLVYFSRKVQVNQLVFMSCYYQFIWVLFFGEYIFFVVVKWI